MWGRPVMITGYVPRDGAKVCGNIVMHKFTANTIVQHKDGGASAT